MRDGEDVFKALALGARMVNLLQYFILKYITLLLLQVFFGRPALWGLAHSGGEGVKKILSLIEKQFDVVLALTGNFVIYINFIISYKL